MNVYNDGMLPRFYAPHLRPDDAEVLLPPDEGRHLARVLRLQPGARVRVFDGRGTERVAAVVRVASSGVLLALGDPVAAAPEARVAVTLGQALLKGDKFDAVVRDAVMLGAAAIRPVLAARADVTAAAARRGGRVERWQRVAVSSVKQCGRAVVPDVFPPADLAACLAADASTLRVLLVEPSLDWHASAHAADVPGLLRGDTIGAPRSVLILVGPEGGWTADEIAVARAARCHPLTLGQRTLRADAAALVALSVLFHALGEFAR